MRPHRPPYKDRFTCWVCGSWGDEFDLLLKFWPGSNFEQRRVRLAGWQVEFERQARREELTSLHRGLGSRGMENVYGRDPREDEFCPESDAAIAELMPHVTARTPEELSEKLLLMQRALQVCAKYGLHPLGLAGRVGFEEWTRPVDMRHIAEVGISLAVCDANTCKATYCVEQRARRRQRSRARR